MSTHTVAEYIQAVQYTYNQCYQVSYTDNLYIIKKAFTLKSFLEKSLTIFAFACVGIYVLLLLLDINSANNILAALYLAAVYGGIPTLIIAAIWEQVTGTTKYFFTKSELDELWNNMAEKNKYLRKESPKGDLDTISKLKHYKEMLDSHLIDEEEFQLLKKKEINNG